MPQKIMCKQKVTTLRNQKLFDYAFRAQQLLSKIEDMYKYQSDDSLIRLRLVPENQEKQRSLTKNQSGKKKFSTYTTYVKKKDIISALETGDIRNVRAFSDFNQQKQSFSLSKLNYVDGYAIHLLPNLGGDHDADINEITAQWFEIDFKIFEEYQTSDYNQVTEKMAYYEHLPIIKEVVMTTQKNMKGEISSYRLKAIRTTEAIQAEKEKWWGDHRELLQDEEVINSAGGPHVYFYYDKNAGDIEQFTLIQLALAERFGGDVKVSNLSRPMRAPGFANMKQQPYYVELIQRSSKRYISGQELIEKYNLNLDKARKLVMERHNNAIKPVQYKKNRDSNDEQTISQSSDKQFHFVDRINDMSPPKNEMTLLEAKEYIKTLDIQLFLTNNDLSNEVHHSCYFHRPDHNPSAILYKRKTGEKIISCFACGVRDIIDIFLNEFPDCSYIDSIKQLAEKCGIKVTSTTLETDSYHTLGLNHKFYFELLKGSIHEKYPVLGKYLPKHRIRILDFFNSHAGSQPIVEDWSILWGNKSYPVFYLSQEDTRLHFTDEKDNLIYHRSVIESSTVLLRLFGFIIKVPEDQVPKTLIENARRHLDEHGKKHYKTISFYIRPCYYDVLSEANRIAQLLDDSGIKVYKNMHKSHLEVLLGKELADKAFPDDRKLPAYFSKVEVELEQKLQAEMTESGFTSKDSAMSIKGLRISAGTGRIRVNKSHIQIVLDIVWNEILERNQWKEVIQSKALAEQYGFQYRKGKRIVIPKVEE
ncbi:DNA-primase RepB domain-containing protein [Paenibacillus flagellatus]|uniref:RepB-like DNA primase domain-containing protein n=1 Tax=Paenibacillus flagellatus TaxID=2211139 RepID=A0A2V5KID8_9BACL|nr:DNA-primase RepB domain-containing protein [Paenibacillus flagellatus]PYI49987.1 hypothetical protein DLM86_31250 [Paenibacillus flagellatus]